MVFIYFSIQSISWQDLGNKEESQRQKKRVEKSFDIKFTYDLVWFGFILLNATFNNISVISWQSVVLVEEIRVPGENH
jgi:hypothetical protein